MKIEEVEDEPQISDKKLESALKMLKTYEKARDEGIAPKNSELEVLLEAMKQQQCEPLAGGITLPKVASDRAKSEIIVPKPFFVVKTTDKGEKIFINICGSPKIPAPAEWHKGIPTDVQEALKENNDLEGSVDIPNVRFPVSCSEPVNSTDHGGKPCRVFDMVYNSSIVEFTMSNRKLKLFLIEMATTWISQKYTLELSSDFKLPHMKYKGSDVPSQQIRATSTGPLVSEVLRDSDLEPSFPLLMEAQVLKVHGTKGNESSSSIPHNLPTGASHVTPNHLPKTSQACCEELLAEIRPSTPASTSNRTTSCGMLSLSEGTSSESQELVPSSDDRDIDGVAWIAEEKHEKLQHSVADQPTGQPLVEMGYSSRPVDAVFLMISFPKLALQDLEVIVTYTEILITTKLYEAIQVSLPFCSELGAAEASYDSSSGLLSLKLPYLSYAQALNVRTEALYVCCSSRNLAALGSCEIVLHSNVNCVLSCL